MHIIKIHENLEFLKMGRFLIGYKNFTTKIKGCLMKKMFLSSVEKQEQLKFKLELDLLKCEFDQTTDQTIFFILDYGEEEYHSIKVQSGFHVYPFVNGEIPFMSIQSIVNTLSLPVGFKKGDIVFFDGRVVSVKSFYLLPPEKISELPIKIKNYSKVFKQIRRSI